MSQLRSIPIPGPGRITLAALAVVPAVMAYPWHTTRDYWVLGVAVAVVVALFGWWGRLHFTTILGRRLAMTGRRGKPIPPAGDATATALLRIGAPVDERDVLPLPVIAGYLDRYGIRADKIRITSRGNASDASRRETWVGLTISAADNLAALQARSSRIPLQETAEVAARRLADHLREIGWDANTVGVDDVPRLITPKAHETWSALQRGTSDYVVAYRVSVDDALAQTLDAVRSHPSRETCTALEIAGGGSGRPHTVAAACAFLTEAAPDNGTPLPGLIAQRGNQLPALIALDLLATQRLDGHTEVADGVLAGLDWPTPEAGSHRASEARTLVEHDLV